MRYQAHPNFIRWVIFNGNRERVAFARCLGVVTITAGFMAALFLTLSRAGRWWRALAAIGWFIGVSTLFAAWKGMCVVRDIHPWQGYAGRWECSLKTADGAKPNLLGRSFTACITDIFNLGSSSPKKSKPEWSTS